MMRLLLGCCLLLGLAGCTASKPQGVSVFAAISTKEPLEQIAHDFQAQTGTPVTCSFASSSKLARQIEQGGGADVFLSADERWADYLADKGLVAQRRDLLANRLVVVTSAARPLQVQRLADLTNGEVKHLAVAPDAVPAGHYAREALKKAGLWEQLKDRTREAGDVRATLNLVVRDEADAGFVYATDAIALGDKVRVALEVPESLHPPIRYPVVLVKPNGDSLSARAFCDYLDSEKAQAVFRKAGFQVLSVSDASQKRSGANASAKRR